MKKIIFTYNANSGYLNSLMDGLHKAVKPSTYQCQLCTLTYGTVSMKKEWKAFIKSLPYPVEIMYRDELEKKHPKSGLNFPSVSILEKDKFTEIISSSQFDKLESLEDLMKTLTEKLS